MKQPGVRHIQYKNHYKAYSSNCVAPVIVQVTLGIAGAILTAAGMSFIGLGIQPPNPEWGNMLSSGRDYIRGYAYMTMFQVLPSLSLFSP